MSTRVEPGARRGGIHAFAVPALVLLLGAGIVTWAANRTPASPPAAAGATTDALQRSLLVCPTSSVSRANGSPTDLTVVSLPATTGATGGRVAARPLVGGPALDGLALGEPAHAAAVRIPADAAAGRIPADAAAGRIPADAAAQVVVRGTGDLAPGLDAFARTSALRDVGGGLAVARCAAPARSWQFLGAGATVDHLSTVVISNPGAGEAVADVEISGPDGLLDTVGTSGLVIEARDSTTLELSHTAAAQDDLAVVVQTRQGQVVASVLDQWSDGVAPAGTEWLPALMEPAEVVLLPITGGGDHTLLVANPGSGTVQVVAMVSDAGGTFVPHDLPTLEVAPQSVTALALPLTPGRSPVTLRLRSSGPVTATVRTMSRTDRADVSYAAASLPLSGPAAAPLEDGLPDVVLTGADADLGVSAVVECRDRDGDVLTTVTVDVPAGSTQVVDGLRHGQLGRAAYVVVSPQQGAVLAAAGYEGSSGVSELGLRTPVQSAVTPVVTARE